MTLGYYIAPDAPVRGLPAGFDAWPTSQVERVRERTRKHYRQRDVAAAELAVQWKERAARPVTSRMSDRELCDLAERRAALMVERIADLSDAMTRDAMRAWLCGQVEALDGRPFPEFSGDRPEADQLSGMVRRAGCRLWWRRQLRRACVRKREAEGLRAGEISKRTRQPYCTDDTVRRRAERNAANAAMLAATELEADDGERITLDQAVAASVSNKAIRRGELMTRIRGCEEWATDAGMVGLFTTNTAPSRFHHQTIAGTRNPKADGTYGPIQPNGPRDAQAWLCATWSRARAALQRAGVRFFGFRVAEPHHDGCPHWHMLVWCDPGKLDTFRAIVRRYWLADHGDESGAQEHRVKFVQIDPERGSAVGYVSKYIAKNIDDINTPMHLDEQAGVQGELFDASAKRVEAWASAHGIRQFQALGQPPVTVWRELRRVPDERVEGMTGPVADAHRAANRGLFRRACWRGYLEAQGGAMTGRAYRVRLAQEREERPGRYETVNDPRPVGVEDAASGMWVLSDRREWRTPGAWADAPGARVAELTRAAPPLRVDWRQVRARSAPRTRVNNCTGRLREGTDPRPLFGPGGLVARGLGGLVGLAGPPSWAIEPRQGPPHQPRREPS